MAFIHKTKCAVVFTLVFIGTLMACSAFAQNTPSASQPLCHATIPQLPTTPIFTNLRAVGLFVRVPDEYRLPGTSAPNALLPDTIAATFQKMIQERILPLVVPSGPDCHVPPLHVFNASIPNNEDLARFAFQPGTLILIVHLSTIDITAPHVGILTVSFFRTDLPPSAAWDRAINYRRVVIPMNLDDKAIAERMFAVANETAPTAVDFAGER